MATYKVLQDIEAEDKLLGPLTLRQFVYSGITLFLGFIAFKIAAINIFFAMPLLLPMAFFGLLAAPFGHDQSSEVWLLAKIRFTIKPRRRIWDQTGMKELVSVTVPKHLERNLTNGLSQGEVSSRLQALANTLDSRGWAVKNVNVNLYNEPSYANSSDRLIDAHSLPQEVPNYEVVAADDILDEVSNPTASALDSMIIQREQTRHQNLVAVAHGAPVAQAPAAPLFVPPADDTNTDEQALLDKIHAEQSRPDPMNSHLKRVQPMANQQPTISSQQPTSQVPVATDNNRPATTSSKPANPDILRLASNDDLNISTIAHEAKKATELPPDDEVVISLR